MSILDIRKFLMGTAVLVGASAVAFTPLAFAQDAGEVVK